MSSTTPPPDFGLFTSLRFDPQLVNSSHNTELSGNGKPLPFYNFIYHYERLVDALDHFRWSLKVEGKDEDRTSLHPKAKGPVEDMEKFRTALESSVEKYFVDHAELDRSTQSLKLRPVLSRQGQLDIQISTTPGTTLQNLFPPSPLPPPSSIANQVPQLIKSDYKVVLDTLPMVPSSYTAYKTTPRPHYDASRMRVGLVDETAPTEVLIWNPDRFVMEGSRTNVYFYRDGVWVTPSEETGCLRGTERRWLIEKGMVNVKDLKVDEVQDGEVVLLSNGLRGIWAATIQK